MEAMDELGGSLEDIGRASSPLGSVASEFSGVALLDEEAPAASPAPPSGHAPKSQPADEASAHAGEGEGEEGHEEGIEDEDEEGEDEEGEDEEGEDEDDEDEAGLSDVTESDAEDYAPPFSLPHEAHRPGREGGSEPRAIAHVAANVAPLSPQELAALTGVDDDVVVEEIADTEQLEEATQGGKHAKGKSRGKSHNRERDGKGEDGKGEDEERGASGWGEFRVSGAGCGVVNGLYRLWTCDPALGPVYVNAAGVAMMRNASAQFQGWVLCDIHSASAHCSDCYYRLSSLSHHPPAHGVAWNQASLGAAPSPTVTAVVRDSDWQVLTVPPVAPHQLTHSLQLPSSLTRRLAPAHEAVCRAEAMRVVMQRLAVLNNDSSVRKLCPEERVEVLRREAAASRRELGLGLTEACEHAFAQQHPRPPRALATLLKLALHTSECKLENTPQSEGQGEAEETGLSTTEAVVEWLARAASERLVDTPRDCHVSGIWLWSKPDHVLDEDESQPQRPRDLDPQQASPPSSPGSDVGSSPRGAPPVKFCTDAQFDKAWRFVHRKVDEGMARDEAYRIALRDILGNKYRMSSLKVKMWKKNKQMGVRHLTVQPSARKRAAPVSSNAEAEWDGDGDEGDSPGASLERRLLTSRRSGDNIGEDFQATPPPLAQAVPAVLDGDEQRLGGELVWAPRLPPHTVNEYVRMASNLKSLADSLGNDHGALCIPRESPEEACLRHLQLHDHSVHKALDKFYDLEFPAAVWNAHEQLRAELGLIRNGADLSMVAQMVGKSKTEQDVVQWFFYRKALARARRDPV